MNQPNPHERRRLKRRNVSYYLPILDNSSQKVVGHLVDISPVGLMMDSKVPIPTNMRYDLRLDFVEAISGKAYLQFNARSKWCRPDSIQPFLFNVGFEFLNISPSDLEIVKRIMEKYGAG